MSSQRSAASLTLAQLADVRPGEDASLAAAGRYHPPASSAVSHRAAAESTIATTVAAPRNWTWMPARISSREQMEQAMDDVQSRIKEIVLGWQGEQHRQQQEYAVQMEAATATTAGPRASPQAMRSLSPPPKGHLPPSSPPAALFLPSSSTAGNSEFSAFDLLPPPPPLPLLPAFGSSGCRSLSQRLRALQSFLRSFEYNHLGHEFTPKINALKHKPWDKLVVAAKDIISQGLPIKCLEAVIVSAYVSREWDELQRFPLRFKTRSGGHSYWHIVLAVAGEGKFGSLGLSRRSTLDYRPLLFPTLSELVSSFKEAYAEVGHTIHFVTVGLPMPGRKEYAPERVFWHFLQLPVLQLGTVQSIEAEWHAVCEVLDKYSRVQIKIGDVMRKASSSSATGGSTNNTSSSSSAAPPPLFVPATTLKVACGLAPTAPLLHPHLHYDSIEVALVYRPAWTLGGNGVDKGEGSNGTAATKTKKKKRRSEENDSSGSESESEEEEHHQQQQAQRHHGSTTTHSHSEQSGSGSSDDDDGSSKNDSVKGIVAPSATASSSGGASLAKQRRMAERAERRRCRQLVESLKERYRHPIVVTEKGNTVIAAPPMSPVISPAGSRKKAPILRPSHSPVRPAGLSGSPQLRAKASPLSPPSGLSLSATFPSSSSSSLTLSPAPAASGGGASSARLTASAGTAAVVATASKVRAASRPRASPSPSPSPAKTTTAAALPSRTCSSPVVAGSALHAARRRSKPRALLPPSAAAAAGAAPSATVISSPSSSLQSSPSPSASPQSGTSFSLPSPPVAEGVVPAVLQLRMGSQWEGQQREQADAMHATVTHAAAEEVDAEVAAATGAV